jgi:hypothetical protein
MTGAVHGVIASYANGIVTLSGETITGTDNTGPTYSASAALVVKADGTLDKIETGVGTTQIDAATDWILPNSYGSSDYEVMIHEDSGTLNRPFQDAIDTWISLAGDRDWGVQYSSSGTGSKTCTATLSIRKDGGPVIDTAVYVFTAQGV